MLRPRIIPCLLIHNGALVKTINFKNPVYIGDPLNAVKIFNEKHADELIVIDIDATVDGKEPNYKVISELASECRMPLCYGGGISRVEQAQKIINLGVEKISLSAAAVNNNKLIAGISAEIGSQSVAVVLDVKRNDNNVYEVWTHNAKINTNRSVLDFLKIAEASGAGEIIINSIERDGQMNGYDLELASQLRDNTRLPMTFIGGCGNLNDISDLIRVCGIVGAAVGSLFVFKGPYRAVLITYPSMIKKEKILLDSNLPTS